MAKPGTRQARSPTSRTCLTISSAGPSTSFARDTSKAHAWAFTAEATAGLLVELALTQRPDLFGVAYGCRCARHAAHHTASANARSGQSDYGLSEDAQTVQGVVIVLSVSQREEGDVFRQHS